MHPLPITTFTPLTAAMVAHIERLAAIESPSTDKAAVDRFGAALSAELLALGATLRTHPQNATGDHIQAEWGSGTGGILVLCHMDTVWDTGTLQRMPLHQKDGRLYGPGTLDMKGGIVLLLTALETLRAHQCWPERPITALFTSDEETGSLTSHALIEELAARAELALCLEPTLANGALKTARKGTGDIELVTHGRAAHAGINHEKGRNAIEELAHHILTAQRLTDYTRGTTVNVGVISGGTRPNVVPEEGRALIDFRITDPAEIDRLAAWAGSLQPVLEGTSVEATFTVNRPPMPRDERMAATFQKVQALGRQLGLDLQEGSTGGGSDANFVAPLGVAVMDGLGPVGDGSHAAHEHVLIDSLPERAALLAAILCAYPGD